MAPRSHTRRECARALWLLGLTPPVDEAELARAFRARIARAHPDRHHGAPRSRADAATLLSAAMNDARNVVAGWIENGEDWPCPQGDAVARTSSTAARRPAGMPRPICPHTGLRSGDLVRAWPYDGEPVAVLDTEIEAGVGTVWVRFVEGGSERAERVRLAAYSCPVCGQCAGPERERYVLRPCPECLADLRRLERRAGEARRVRTAIEARSEAGRAVAEGLRDDGLELRAVERRRWARRLRQAGPDDLHAALVGAFTRAYEHWAGDNATGPNVARAGTGRGR